MKKLELKPISFEKQMTVILPLCAVILLLIGILCVNRVRATAGEKTRPSKQGQMMWPMEKPLQILCVLHEDQTVYYSLLFIHPSGSVTVRAVDDSAIDREESIDYVQEALQADYYVSLSFENMRKLLRYYTDGVSVTTSQSLQYTNAAGVTVAFPRGSVRVASDQLADFLRALANDQSAAETIAQLHADMFERYRQKTQDKSDFYTVVTMYADTDIRIYDFERYKPLVYALDKR